MDSKWTAWILAAITVGIAIYLFWSVISPKAEASYVPEIKVEECDDTFTYTKEGDFNDSRVDINFQDSDEAITVTAKAGYELVSVQLNVEDDNHAGFYTYPVVNGVKFNPNPGQDIEVAKVVVKKVCVTPTPDPTATPSATPFNRLTDAEDKCPNLDGVQTSVPEGRTYVASTDTCDQIVNVTPTPVLATVTELPATGPSALPLVGGLMILGSGLSFWLIKRGLEE